MAKSKKNFIPRKEVEELIQEDRAFQREEEKRKSGKRRKGRKKMSFDEFVQMALEQGNLG